MIYQQFSVGATDQNLEQPSAKKFNNFLFFHRPLFTFYEQGVGVI